MGGSIIESESSVWNWMFGRFSHAFHDRINNVTKASFAMVCLLLLKVGGPKVLSLMLLLLMLRNLFVIVMMLKRVPNSATKNFKNFENR